MIRTCKYCEKEIEYENGKQFGAHLTNCKLNPSKLKRDLDSKKTKEYNLICKCGESYTINITEYTFIKGNYKKYCSLKCSNKRKHNDETKNKIAKTLSTGIIMHKKECIECMKEFETKKKTQVLCSMSCSSLYKIKNYRTNFPYINNNDFYKEIGRKGGLKSVQSQNKRSKNEIAFGDLCKNNFNNVLFNEQLFNGWDADIILENEKVAILWNGIWHYEKITEKHSVKQVQNRDNIKIKEMEKLGYTPYIIKDMGKYNEEKVKMEWNIFNIWLKNKNVEII